MTNADTQSQSTDAIGQFIDRMALLPIRHPRRIALMLAQLGLLITVASFCISIAGMNIGLATCFAGCLFAGAPLHRCVGVVPFFLFISWIGVSMLLSDYPTKWVASASVPIGLLAAQIAFHPRLPGAEKVRNWVVKILVVTICASVLLALAQFVIGKGGAKPLRIDPNGPRFFQSTGFFGLQLTQGAVMGMLCLLLGGLAIGMHGWWQRIGQGISILGVTISGSRGALLGFVAGVSLAIATKGKKYVLVGGGVCLVLLVVALLFLKAFQPERLHNLLAMKDGRWPIWKTSLHIVEQQPLFGAGGSRAYKDAYLEAYPKIVVTPQNEFMDGAPHAHNTHLSQAAEYGIPVAIFWLAMLLIPLCHLRRNNLTLFQAGVGMTGVALVFGQFENLDGETSRVLWTGMGMLLALNAYNPQSLHNEPNGVSDSDTSMASFS